MHKKCLRKNNRGFSLVELIIIIAIIGIIAGVSWSTMDGVKKRAAAQNACEQVAAMINKTRNYALSGKTVSAGNPTSFTATVNGSSVSISSVSPNTTMDTFNIPGGVSCSNSPINFSFTVPYGVCTGCGSPSTSLNCSASGGGASRTVTITPNSAVCN